MAVLALGAGTHRLQVLWTIATKPIAPFLLPLGGTPAMVSVPVTATVQFIGVAPTAAIEAFAEAGIPTSVARLYPRVQKQVICLILADD